MSYVWNLGRNPYVYAQKIPSELVLVERSEDDYQAIKLVLESTYELKHGEYYLDDVEDMALTYAEAEESDSGLMNDSDDDNNSPRSDRDSNPNEPDPEEDEDEGHQTFVDNERLGEIATLEGHISDYNDKMANERSPSGIMTFITLINMAEGRCRELREQIRNGGQS